MKNSFLTFLTVFCFIGAQAQILKTGNIKAGQTALKALTLSDADVIALCDQSIAWLDENNPVAQPGDPYADRLERLTKDLKNIDGLNLNYKVYRVVDINAFAMANGEIRVFAGLMDLMTDDELLSVIGHEIGHVKYKHSKKAIRSAYLLVAGKEALEAANSGSAGAALSGSDVEKFVEELSNAQFSQSHESQSDQYSFDFMVKHGFDYHAGATAFEKLAKLSADGGKGNLMSSHPGAAKRAKKYAKRAKEQDKK